MKTEYRHIEQAIIDQRNEETNKIALFTAVRKAMEKWQGKKINKRVVTHIRAALEGAGIIGGLIAVHYEVDKVSIWGSGIDAAPGYEKRVQIWFGHNVVFSLAEFDRVNTCYYGAAIERNVKRGAELADCIAINNLVDAANEYKAAGARLAALLKGPFDTDRYAIERACNLRDRSDRRIDFSDLD